MNRLDKLEKRLSTLDELKENYTKGLEIIKRTQSEIIEEILTIIFDKKNNGEKELDEFIDNLQINILNKYE